MLASRDLYQRWVSGSRLQRWLPDNGDNDSVRRIDAAVDQSENAPITGNSEKDHWGGRAQVSTTW